MSSEIRFATAGQVRASGRPASGSLTRAWRWPTVTQLRYAGTAPRGGRTDDSPEETLHGPDRIVSERHADIRGRAGRGRGDGTGRGDRHDLGERRRFLPADRGAADYRPGRAGAERRVRLARRADRGAGQAARAADRLRQRHARHLHRPPGRHDPQRDGRQGRDHPVERQARRRRDAEAVREAVTARLPGLQGRGLGARRTHPGVALDPAQPLQLLGAC